MFYRVCFLFVLLMISENLVGNNAARPVQEIYRVKAVSRHGISVSNESSVPIIYDVFLRRVHLPLKPGFYILKDRSHTYKLIIDDTGRNITKK